MGVVLQAGLIPFDIYIQETPGLNLNNTKVWAGCLKLTCRRRKSQVL